MPQKHTVFLNKHTEHFEEEHRDLAFDKDGN